MSQASKKLFVVYNLGAGGAERFVATLANAWAKQGDQVRILVMSAAQESFYPLAANIEVEFLALAAANPGGTGAWWNNFRRVARLRKAIKAFGPELTLGVMTSMNVLTILATRGLNTRVIATEHIHPPKFPLNRFWEMARRRTYRYADLVTAPTQTTGDWLRAKVGVKAIAAIPNPLVMPIPVTPPVVDSATHFAESSKLICAVGRLSPQKGFDLLIPVFAKLAQDFPDWSLAILGEGEQRAALEQLIGQWHMESRIKLIGTVGNLSHWYERSEIYVMSSRFEGFGNTLAEAMAHGCACVSFDCAAGPSTIIRGDTEGILVPAEDTSALEMALRKLLDDPQQLARLRNQEQKALSRFGELVIVEQWSQLTRKLL